MNPYVILGAVVLWAISLFGVGHWQNNAGHEAERLVWQERANTELATANAKILQMENDARETEHQHSEEVAAAAAKYEKEKTNVIAQKDAAIASLRSGTLRLRDPYSPGIKTCGDPIGAIATATGGRDGGAPTQLSGETSEFLISLASEADEVVKQLQACQAIVLSDRKTNVEHDPPK